jgi:hypothetical protein
LKFLHTSHPPNGLFSLASTFGLIFAFLSSIKGAPMTVSSNRDPKAEALDHKLAAVAANTNKLAKLLRQTKDIFTAVTIDWAELKTELVRYSKDNSR